MSPIYLNQPSAISLPERDRDREQSHIISPFNKLNDRTSSFSSPVLFHSLQDQDHGDHHLQQVQHLQQEEIINEQYLIAGGGGLSNCTVQYPRIDGENSEKMELPLFSEGRVREELNVPGEWMPSKMRIIRKITHSDLSITSSNSSIRYLQESDDQTRSSKGFSTSSNHNSNSPCDVIRFCSNCHTTKTPLWRSGPSGPKSLCNACGIRQRKARRAMAMAAAAAAGGGLVPAVHAPAAAKARIRDRKLDFDQTVPFKKRCKFTNAIRTRTTAAATHQRKEKKKKKKLCSEDVKLSVSTSSKFHQVFPQDERDAAILLMALSYGLVRS